MAADTFVERTSMYMCDYDNVTPLGNLPVFEPGPTKAEIARIEKVMDDCHIQLSREHETTVLKSEDIQFINDMWVYRFDECCTEIRGDSVSDALFVARCHILCCQVPQCRGMSVFKHIHELYVRLQLLGTNHTRRRFDELDSHMEVVRLEQRCASLVVYELSESPEDLLAGPGSEPLPQLDEVLLALIAPLRDVPDIVKPTEEELKAAAEKAASDKLALLGNEAKHDDELVEVTSNETEYDVNEGQYWHSDRVTIIRGFVRLASRVLRNYWLQKFTFDKYPICKDVPTYPESAKQYFTEWLKEMTRCDFSDDSVKQYRNLVYEHWMPVGSRQEMLRTFQTKHDFLQALNLLEHQLGVNSATSLANMARVKNKIVAQDPANEVYDFLLLSQFGDLFKHVVDEEFFKQYYIMPGELCKWRKRLDCKITWGQPRRPILLRIMRGWWIHEAGEWIACTSMMDALLKMMTLWVKKYNSTFASTRSCAEWVALVTTERKEDEY